MANITIFIDETGSFSRKSRSFIGGWVCKSDDVSNIKGMIKSSVRFFNDYLKAEQLESYTLEYPEDMHFMPLHLQKLREGKDSSITVPPEHAPVFFSHLFKEIHNITLQVFRSTGKPVIKPNEQAVYIEILRNTLLQLLDQSVSLYENVKLDIIIAHRRHPSLYGEEGIKDYRAYENHLKEELTKELVGAFTINKPAINITFADARYTSGLIVADFFCGALRWEDNSYLKEYKETKYPFANGYKQIGSRMIQRIRFVEETDVPLAAMLCADVLSGDPQNSEVKSFLVSLLGKMTSSDKSFFCKSMIDLFTEKLDNDPDRYTYLHNMNELLTILLPILSTDYGNMPQSELQLVAAIFLNKIRIDSHIGKVNCHDGIKQFLSFLDEYGELTFDNQMQIMQQRIDVTLLGVQLDEFNSFKFDDIESTLKDVKDKYYGMFNFEPEKRPVKDNNLARIEGTLGQMYGFQCDIEKDNDFFEMAELCLQTDISACIKNTSSWEKANGYLTSLYWKNRDLDKAIIQFLKESGTDLKNRDEIFELDKVNLFSARKKPFIQLHRLYLCALASKNNIKITGLLTEKEYLLKQCDVTAYPLILSAKWLAILFLMDGDCDNAIEILDAALANEQAENRDIINLPLQLLQHYTLINLGKKSNFVCQNEVEMYADLNKEIKDSLLKLGVERYYQHESEWSVYEIGTFLPFYLS
jgi:hypothetical protein